MSVYENGNHVDTYSCGPLVCALYLTVIDWSVYLSGLLDSGWNPLSDTGPKFSPE